MHIYKAAAADIGPPGQALVININSLRVTGGSWNREATTACAFTELLPLISAPHGKKTHHHSRVHTDLAPGTSPFIGFEKKKHVIGCILVIHGPAVCPLPSQAVPRRRNRLHQPAAQQRLSSPRPYNNRLDEVFYQIILGFFAIIILFYYCAHQCSYATLHCINKTNL